MDAAYDPSLAPRANSTRDRAPCADPEVAFAEHPQLGIVAATSDHSSALGGQLILEEHGWRLDPNLDIYTLPTHGGRSYRRILTEEDLVLAPAGRRTPVRVRDDAGNLVQIEAEEETAFWDWVTVETLRNSGVRIEEMCEISHLSIRHYQRSNGEMVALLVISPSKTDRERVFPMSAELFHAIASIIRRHSRNGGPVPVLRRFDQHDKVFSPPMPFLFQRKIGSTGALSPPRRS